MENSSGIVKRENEVELKLPPGFRFHPTDEELITHYLWKKTANSNFTAVAIGEADMNKIEPWELPRNSNFGEKECYFFCLNDKKYPTGIRTNRATPSGYWKATGKDKEIFRGKTLVGMKKTLVFYKGRAPKGEKSNWVSHEYRLEGRLLSKSSSSEWVITRVFEKSCGVKKVQMSHGEGDELEPVRGDYQQESGNVHCFSNSFATAPIFMDSFSSEFPWGQFPGENSIARSFLGSYGQNLNQGFKKQRDIGSVSQETENSSVVSCGIGKKVFDGEEGTHSTQDLDSIWNY